MKKFTVILLYPDYLSENFGHDVYTAHVDAAGPGMAIRRAQEMATTKEFVKDFHPIAIFHGHQENFL